MEIFEIWIGYVMEPQGHDPLTEPMLVAKMSAASFEVACFKYELGTTLRNIMRKESNGLPLNQGDLSFDYNPRTNRNSWTGLYYPSREEALKSFQ